MHEQDSKLLEELKDLWERSIYESLKYFISFFTFSLVLVFLQYFFWGTCLCPDPPEAYTKAKDELYVDPVTNCTYSPDGGVINCPEIYSISLSESLRYYTLFSLFPALCMLPIVTVSSIVIFLYLTIKAVLNNYKTILKSAKFDAVVNFIFFLLSGTSYISTTQDGCRNIYYLSAFSLKAVHLPIVIGRYFMVRPPQNICDIEGANHANEVDKLYKQYTFSHVGIFMLLVLGMVLAGADTSTLMCHFAQICFLGIGTFSLITGGLLLKKMGTQEERLRIWSEGAQQTLYYEQHQNYEYEPIEEHNDEEESDSKQSLFS